MCSSDLNKSREPPRLREIKPSRVPTCPRGTSSREPKYPRVTSYSTSLSTNHRGELKPMQLMQWQEHTKWSRSSNPNPTKATNAWEGLGRKNKGGTQRNSKDLDPKCSPHLEEKSIGGNTDLNLLSLFSQKVATTIGEIERKPSLRRSTMEGENSSRSWQRG